MTKIFEAFKKQSGQAADISYRLSRVGVIAVFPPPKEAQQKEFDKLANRLLGLRTRRRGMVLAFASTASGEGTSFVSYHVANALALGYDQKVAWIDANYLSPQRKLQATELMTLASLLQDPARVDYLPSFPSPLPIPAGYDLTEVRHLLADDQYPEVLGSLAGRFDFTILDLPPVVEANDTAQMASKADGLLLVIEQKYLKWEIIKEGVRSLEELSVHVLGSVINRRRYELPKFIYDRL